MASGLSNPIEEGLVVLPDTVKQVNLSANTGVEWTPPAGTRAALFCPSDAVLWIRKYDTTADETDANVFASGHDTAGFVPTSGPALFKIEEGFIYQLYAVTGTTVSIGIYGRT